MKSLQGTVPSDQEVAKAVAGVTERHLEEKRKEERRRRREQEREAKEDKRWGTSQESVEMPQSDREFFEMLHRYSGARLNISDRTVEDMGRSPRPAVKKVSQSLFDDDLKDDITRTFDYLRLNPNIKESGNRVYVTKRYFYEQFLTYNGRDDLDISIQKVCRVMKSMGVRDVRRNNSIVWAFGKK